MLPFFYKGISVRWFKGVRRERRSAFPTNVMYRFGNLYLRVSGKMPDLRGLALNSRCLDKNLLPELANVRC